MAKFKNLKVADLIDQYDDKFIESISLKDITNNKELKELCIKLEKANYVVTKFYQMMYNDYIIAINSDSSMMSNAPSIDSVKKYKSLSSKIQKAYNYVTYLVMFDNPFKSGKK